MTIEQLIKSLGGVTSVRKELKIKYNSIVYGWIRRGVIPSWRIPALIELAQYSCNWEALQFLENYRGE